MSRYIINGPCVVEGELEIQGAKNSILPLLSATLLTEEKTAIHNCPDIRDVRLTLEILKSLGCKAELRNGAIETDTATVSDNHVPDRLMREMRSSVIFLGSLIARTGAAKITSPGGCELGPRPIDLHISSLKKLGVSFSEEGGFITARCDGLKGADIYLSFPSVGATENTMLAAALAKGATVIHNAAREPEIGDLQAFLNSMGARIHGAGSGTIEIEGVKKLHGSEHSIIPDRIASATYMAAAALTGGELVLKRAQPRDIIAVTETLAAGGAEISTSEDSIHIVRRGRIKPLGLVRTMPYPGFPTDALALLMTYATLADGTTVFVENIFENRFKQAAELARMGAAIRTEGRIAVVEGTNKLTGAQLVSTDLRGGAALVLAGIAAYGQTIVDKAELIERGYENMPEKLAALGCNIIRE